MRTVELGVIHHYRVEDKFPCRRVNAAQRLVEHIELCVPAHHEQKLQFLLHTL